MTVWSNAIALAKADVELVPTLNKHFKSSSFLTESDPAIPGKELVSAMSQKVLAKVQLDYSTNSPKVLRFLVYGDNKTANALAVWTKTNNDWIVVSTGLLSALHAGAKILAQTVFDLYPNLSLSQRLHQSQSKFDSDLTDLSELLFAASFTYFICHEAGHHYDGHDGFYTGGAHSLLNNGGTTLDQQALELGADYFGARWAMRIIGAYLLSLTPLKEFTQEEQNAWQSEATFLIALGLLLAMLIYKPRPLSISKAMNSTHPPSAFRALWFMSITKEHLLANFKSLSEQTILQITLEAAQVASAAAIFSDEKAIQNITETYDGNPDLAILGASGIHKVIMDEKYSNYFSSLHARYRNLKPRLASSARGADAMPMQLDAE